PPKLFVRRLGPSRCSRARRRSTSSSARSTATSRPCSRSVVRSPPARRSRRRFSSYASAASRSNVFEHYSRSVRDHAGLNLELSTRATLKSVLAKAGPGLRLNDYIEDDGPTVFAHACKMGLEGIVSKRKG